MDAEKMVWMYETNIFTYFYSIEEGASETKDWTWSLSTKTARTPSAKSFRREDLTAMRYSVFITLLSWTQPNAVVHMLLHKFSCNTKSPSLPSPPFPFFPKEKKFKKKELKTHCGQFVVSFSMSRGNSREIIFC